MARSRGLICGPAVVPHQELAERRNDKMQNLEGERCLAAPSARDRDKLLPETLPQNESSNFKGKFLVYQVIDLIGSPGMASNHRPDGKKPSALPTELPGNALGNSAGFSEKTQYFPRFRVIKSIRESRR